MSGSRIAVRPAGRTVGGAAAAAVLALSALTGLPQTADAATARQVERLGRSRAGTPRTPGTPGTPGAAPCTSRRVPPPASSPTRSARHRGRACTEAALADHPAVSAAVDVVRGDRPGDRRLVGYAARAAHAGGAPADPAGLRSFVRDRLPAYMVPSAVVVLDELPLTANGKADRAAHPDGGAERRRPRRVARPGRHRRAQRLLRPRRPLPAGHATRERVRTEFAVDVSLRGFSESPTVAELAEQILTPQAAALDESELDSLPAELTDE